MTMTEEEARKKWCPFAHVTHRGMKNVASWNRFEDVPPKNTVGVSCIASECMAWRFKPRKYRHHSFQSDDYVNTRPENAHGVKGKPLKRKGYCGLAGPK